MQNSILLENITREEFFTELREIVSQVLDKRLKPEPTQLYVTKKEAAAKLRLSLPTLGRLTSDGTLHGYRVGRRVLYKADEIENALKEIQPLKYKRS